MRRSGRIGIVSLAMALLAATAGAAETSRWPAFPLDPEGFRGPGFYLGAVKLVVCWLLFLAWAGTTDWVNRDCQEHKGPYLRWNALTVLPFLAAMGLLWAGTPFALGFLLLLLAYGGPLGGYLAWREPRVQPYERILSGQFWREKGAELLAPLGIKIALEPRSDDGDDRHPLARLFPRGGRDEAQHGERLVAARESPGYRAARQLLGAAAQRQVASLVLDYAAEAVTVRQLVDGVWCEADPLSREEGDAVLHTLQLLCGLDAAAGQPGLFRAELGEAACAATLVVAPGGVAARVAIHFDQQKSLFGTLEELGMRPAMREQLVGQLLAAPQGLFLFSALPAAGLRTTTSVTLRTLDRFTREFAAFEDATNRYEEVENVPVTVYDASAAGRARHEALQALFRTEPQVVVARDLGDAASLRLLCQQADRGRLILGTMRAKDAAEALLRVLALRVPPPEFARVVSGVLYQRLIRLLCEKCKEPYTPSPALLAQLGIPAGRVTEFYQPPTEPGRVCRACGGIGYRGRTALFQLLVVDGALRQMLAAPPKIDVLRQAARQAGMRTIQEEGLLLVAKGVTSLQELSRVVA